MRFALRLLAGLYLLALLVVWGFIARDTGDSWLVTLFLFSPRWVVALPLLVLVPLTIWKSPRISSGYIVHVILILFPIMGASLGISGDAENEESSTFRLITCNLGGGETNMAQLISLAKHHQADAVLLQECPESIASPVFQALQWNHRQKANMAIGSRHDLGELRVLSRHPESKFNAIASVACELTYRPSRAGRGSERNKAQKLIQLVSVHFPTFRPAFERARNFDDKVVQTFVSLRDRYNEITIATKQASQCDATESETSTLIAGDFNVPVESDFYRRRWRSYQNALSLAGRGFNYTKYTRLHGVCIDHILADEKWRVLSAQVGPNLGGDHCPVIAELQCISW